MTKTKRLLTISGVSGFGWADGWCEGTKHGCTKLDETGGRTVGSSSYSQIHVEDSSVLICCVLHDLIPIDEKCHHTPPYPLFLGPDILAPTLTLLYLFQSKEE